MKTTIQRHFAKATGLALLLALGMSLSSCILVDPHHHHRHYRGGYYSQEVRP